MKRAERKHDKTPEPQAIFLVERQDFVKAIEKNLAYFQNIILWVEIIHRCIISVFFFTMCL